MSAPISVAPSISKPATLNPPAAVASVPAKVAFAPLKVNAVVVPDLIIKFPLVFVALPKVVPPSLKKISPPSASKVISVPASIVASAEEEIVKSVPSPSIFSPSSPKVKPMFAGIFISPFDPTVIDKSVPSDSIFSAVAKVSPTPDGIFTSAVAVKLILFPEIVKSVPSPSIFSPS